MICHQLVIHHFINSDQHGNVNGKKHFFKKNNRDTASGWLVMQSLLFEVYIHKSSLLIFKWIYIFHMSRDLFLFIELEDMFVFMAL